MTCSSYRNAVNAAAAAAAADAAAAAAVAAAVVCCCSGRSSVAWLGLAWCMWVDLGLVLV